MPVLEFEISKKWLLLIIAVIAILAGAVIFLVFFNRAPVWVTVTGWDGEATEYSVTTEQFTINGTEWRINWQVRAYDSSPRCHIYVYHADTNQLFAELPQEQQSGEANFTRMGTFYLKIDVHGELESWEVQVHQKT